MAEILVANVSSTLSNQYVSDLPVVNENPVPRQIGWYLPEACSIPLNSNAASAYITNLGTYLAGATFTGDGQGAGQVAEEWELYDAAGTAKTTPNGVTILTVGEYQNGRVTVAQFLARLIMGLVKECAVGDISSVTTATIEAAFDSVTNNGASPLAIRLVATPSTTDEFAGGGSALDIDAGSADISTEGILRIMAGATPDGVGSFSTAYADCMSGNHRLVGGRRRVYTRDRVDGSMNEGFLATFKSTSWSATDGAGIVVFDTSGTVQ